MADGLINYGIIRPDLANAFGRGYNEAEQQRNALAAQQQEQQLRNIQLQNALREQRMAGEEEAAWKTGAGDTQRVLQELQTRGLGKQAIALQGQMQKQQADKIAMLKNTADLLKNSANAVFANPTLDNALTQVTNFGKQTGSDISSEIAALQKIGNDPDAIKQWAAGHAVSADKMLPKIEQLNLGGGVQITPVSPLTGAPMGQATSYGKTMTPYETKHLAVQQGQLAVAQKRLEQETAAGELSPNSLDLAANMYLQTGALPPGMGTKVANVRTQIMNRAAELGMAPQAGAEAPTAAQAAANIVAAKQGVAGQTAAARTLGTTGASMTLGANEASKMIPVAQGYVEKLDPSNYPLLNQAGLFIAKNTGDPNQAGLAASLNALVNSYARAITPRGTPTVSDKNHAREVINSAMSKGQFNEVFNVMNTEMQAAQGALAEVSPATIGRLKTGGGGKAAPSVGAIQDGYRFKGGNPADPNNWEKQ